MQEIKVGGKLAGERTFTVGKLIKKTEREREDQNMGTTGMRVGWKPGV